MVGELITLPLRVTGAAARLSWRAAGQALSLSWSAAGYVVERVSPGGSPDDASWAEPATRPSSTERAAGASPPASPGSQPTSAAPSRPVEPQTAPRATEPPPVPPVEEPIHVSEEPTLVEEFAEPGAEDGAGAQIRIEEPWDGYRHMSAGEVTSRLAGASDAELAAVQLYESSNRGRQTVLAAVARQLGDSRPVSAANGSDSER